MYIAYPANSIFFSKTGDCWIMLLDRFLRTIDFKKDHAVNALEKQVWIFISPLRAFMNYSWVLLWKIGS